MNRLPGWEANSWGYHGDDGHLFSSSGTGKAYGPSFTTNDVVGCGVDFCSNSLFFTKNGVWLGVAFSDSFSSMSLFPSIGLRTPGEIVDANFGSSPFRFDIQLYFLVTFLLLFG